MNLPLTKLLINQQNWPSNQLNSQKLIKKVNAYQNVSYPHLAQPKIPELTSEDHQEPRNKAPKSQEFVASEPESIDEDESWWV